MPGASNIRWASPPTTLETLRVDVEDQLLQRQGVPQRAKPSMSSGV